MYKLLLPLLLAVSLNAMQESQLIDAIRKDDLKSVITIISLNPQDFRDYSHISEIVDVATTEQGMNNFRIRACALYALALLCKANGVLPAFASEAWSRLANDQRNSYNSEPFWSDACRGTIYQLGIHNTPQGHMGISHAIISAHGISNTLMRTSMEEEFFIVDGEGEFWLKGTDGSIERSVKRTGDHFVNPKGQHIQFKNLSGTELKLMVTTTPPYDEVIHNNEDFLREIKFPNDGPF